MPIANFSQMIDSNKPTLLFDGVCNICNVLINFVKRHDKEAKFSYEALQSETGQKLLNQYHLKAKVNLRDKNAGNKNPIFESFVFIDEDKAYTHSSAALQLAKKMKFPWNVFYGFIIIPKPVRDAVYKFIARNRYRWFGRRDE